MRRGADYALNKINSSWYGMSKLSLIIPGLGKAKMSAECQERTLLTSACINKLITGPLRSERNGLIAIYLRL